MTDYKPGQICKATVHGAPDTVMRVSSRTGKLGWRAAGEWFHDHEVTDAHPLIVLDLDWYIPFLTDVVLRPSLTRLNGEQQMCVQEVIDQIEEQTRPAIEEPTGLGAVVEDADGVRHVRADDDGTNWHAYGHNVSEPYWRMWDDIKAVRIISEGVQP